MNETEKVDQHWKQKLNKNQVNYCLLISTGVIDHAAKLPSQLQTIIPASACMMRTITNTYSIIFLNVNNGCFIYFLNVNCYFIFCYQELQDLFRERDIKTIAQLIVFVISINSMNQLENVWRINFIHSYFQTNRMIIFC